MPQCTRSDGLSIYYETYDASPTAQPTPPIVFLNGMTQTTMNWKSQARAFAKAHMHVITYDARGQGKTPVGDLEITLDVHVQDLVQLLNHLELERVTLAGFSHGARIAIAAAAAHQDRVHKLILCSATAQPTPMAQVILQSWGRVLELGGLEALTWTALPSILGQDFLTQNLSILNGVIKASVQRNTHEGISRMLRAMVAFPSLAEIATHVHTPTLVMYSDQDLLVEHHGAAKLARLCHGQLLEIKGVGHTIPIEAPDVFRHHILNFLC